MDRRKLTLLFQTLKYLKFRQVYYRVFYLIRNKFFKYNKAHKQLETNVPQIEWGLNEIFFHNSFSNHSFSFLNIPKEFNQTIDWNFSDFGKLWTYNLNYFDFLNQKEISQNQGLQLIWAYIKDNNNLKDGIEPYPISLRGVNWVKFLSKYKIKDQTIDGVLYGHYSILLQNIEYHLLANHLLENGFSLLFGAYYFQDESMYKYATKILKTELKEQLLSDGAHFELSPMYHQILLHRLLDCIALIEQNSWKQKQLLTFLKNKASLMLSWLNSVTYRNGNIPMVNDSAYNIAPTSKELFNYAKRLHLKWEPNRKLKESGYRKYNNDTMELFVDVGNIEPTYQPGHAHSDTLNFELYIKQNPIIVDTGISTYEKNAFRQKERATSAHNTVQIGDYEQSEIWGGFRVGRRARIIKLEEHETMVKAAHNGYKKLGIIHERQFVTETNSIIINDSLSKKTKRSQKAYLHFHPNINTIEIKKHSLVIDDNINIEFKGDMDTKLSEYQYAIGFNKTQKASKVTIYFDQELETKIHF